jgi:hypothetical protein
MRPVLGGLFLAAVALAGDRPRVLLRQTAEDGCPGLDEVKARAEKDPWKKRLGDLRETTHGKALHWLVTGDEGSAQACLDELRATNPDDGYGLYALGPVLTLPVAYDWLWAWKGFSAADKKLVEEKIVKTADASVAFLKGKGDSVWHTSAPRSLMAVALAGAALDAAKGAEYAAFAKEYFEGVYAPAMAALDGGAVAGMSYAVTEGFHPLLHALWAMKTGRGYDGFAVAKARGDWLNAMGEYLGCQSLPDMTWQRWGDCVTGSRASLKEEARNVLDMLARGGSASAAWLSAQAAKKWPETSAYHASVVPDFFVFGAEEGEPPPEPPRARLFGRATIGQACLRTGWGDDATVVFFKAGDYFDNHGHFDQGAFTIWRKGFLALDSGAYGSFDAAHRMEYARKSIAHNVLVFGTDAEGGQRLLNSQDSGDLADHVAKKKARNLETAEILAWEAREGWAYVAASLGAAYDPKVVASWTREIVFLDSGALVVLDRAKARAPARWLLHTTGEPALETGTFRVTEGSSALAGWTLLPDKAVVKKVGPGCFVDGKDFPPDKVASFGVPGAWRVEVSGGDVFLHVLVPMDAAGALPEVTRDGLGATIGDVRVSFSGSGPGRAEVTPRK